MHVLEKGFTKWIIRVSTNRFSGLIFLSALIGLIYSAVLFGHASLKTDGSVPTGPLFVGDPSAGGAITVPLEHLVATTWSRLTIPMIDPFQGFGIPLLPSQGVSVFFPEILTHLLLPNHYSIWNLVRLDVLAYGTFLLAYSLDLGFSGSLAAGAVAALAGVAPSNANLGMLNPLMVLPFILLAIRYLLDPDYRQVFIAWLGFFTAILLLALSGFQELFPILAITVAVYAVAMALHFRTFQLNPKRIYGVISAGILAIIFGAIGLLPTLSVVQQGFGVNSPHSYRLSYPSYLYSTLAMPKIGGPSMVLTGSTKLITIWILGTPFIGLAVFLSIIAYWRYKRDAFWLVLSSVFMVVIGLLGFSDQLGISNIFGFFPFDSILLTRFLGFLWWIPLCLLLGFVISNSRKFVVVDLLASLVLCLAIDFLLYQRYISAEGILHFAESASQPLNSLLMTSGFMILFLGAMILATRVGGTWLVLAIALVATAISVPNNFFPKGSSHSLVESGVNPAKPASVLADFSGFLQPPANVTAINIFGPLMSPTYLALMDKVFPSSGNYDKYRAVKFSAPTLYFVNVNPRFFSAVGSFGVNEFISITPISSQLATPNCASSDAVNSKLCYLGQVALKGNTTAATGFAYKIANVDPLVFPALKALLAPSSTAAQTDILQLIDHTTGVPSTAYVAGGAKINTSLASDPRGIHRRVSTEGITTGISTASSGLVILRNSYLNGMNCSVNGKATRCLSVDGGLWTAVHVSSGKSRVHLGYVDNLTRFELVLALVGTIGVAIAWLVVLAMRIFGIPSFVSRRNSRLSARS